MVVCLSHDGNLSIELGDVAGQVYGANITGEGSEGKL